MNCKCGFKFSEPGEYRNTQSMMTNQGWVVICPDCGTYYKEKN